MAINAAVTALADQIQRAPVDAGLKDALTKQVQEVQQQLKAYESDVWFYRIVVSGLVASLILVIIAVGILRGMKITELDALASIGSAALGGLIGFLCLRQLAGSRQLDYAVALNLHSIAS